IGDYYNPLDSNSIRFCKGYGLSVIDSAMQVFYYINSMFGNELGGISLDYLPSYFMNGNFNDKYDEDTGSNGLQNTVNTTKAEAKNSSITISGNLEGVPNTIYKIFTYLSKKYDDSDKIKTQGTVYLGMFEVRTYDEGTVQIDTSWSSEIIEKFSEKYPVVTMSVLDIGGSSPFSITQSPLKYVDIEVKIDTSETYVDKDGNAKIVAKITNLGSDIATTVAIKDTLRNIDVKEMAISKGVILLVDSTIIATIPQLNKGESAFYTAYGQYTKVGEYVRSIKAIPSEYDINTTNNIDSIIFRINQVNLYSPIPKFPLHRQKDIDNPLFIKWFKLKDAVAYHLQVSEGPLTLISEKHSDGYVLNSKYIVNDSLISDTTYIIMGLDGNKTYYWRVSGIYSNNEKYWSDTLSFTTVPLTFLSDINNSNDFNISIKPNPTNEIAHLSLDVNLVGNYSIKIVDLMGNDLYKIVENKNLISGIYTFNLVLKSLTQGMYFLVVNNHDTIKTHRLFIYR
ncbi:MAG: T9SS type A sorting domain-containing protein, partial [candidate division WOR-3 bacterium]